MWRYLRQFPKFITAGLIIAASLTILFIWKARRSAREAESSLFTAAPVADTKIQEGEVAANHERMILADNDLYDIDTGAVVFKHWLEKGMPLRLFYDGEQKKIIAQYQFGFVRYGLNGKTDATLLDRSEPAISKDRKWMLYVKDKDIWRADIDWTAFKLVNERKVTAIEQFWPQNFADNIFFWTDKTLIMRNLANLLRVNLETGDVKPMRIPLEGITGRRSPDTENLVGLQGGQFYCFNIDSETSKTNPVGRILFNDYQWLGNDQCVILAAGKEIVLYDRQKNVLSEIMTLPVQSARIGDPSQDGRFVFCVGWGKTQLVDLQNKTAMPVPSGAGPWITNNAFVFSREIPDTELRGTWLQTIGQPVRRISLEPYLVRNARPMIMTLKPSGVTIFVTAHGLSKMNSDDSESESVAKTDNPASQVLGIEAWK